MPGVHSSTRSYILRETPEICALCGDGPRSEDPWTVDHIVPRCFGGSNGRNNLQRAHKSCNGLHGSLLHYAINLLHQQNNGYRPISFTLEDAISYIKNIK